MKVSKKDRHILKTLSDHVNRENFSLYNEVFVPWESHNLLQPRHNHPNQWRKFIKYLGKRQSMLALLEFVPLAMHRAESPLPSYLERYAISSHEKERMKRSLSLIQLWLTSSNSKFNAFRSYKIKKELEVHLGEGEPTFLGGYHMCASNFIHLVGLVLVGKKNFIYYAMKALACTESFGLSTNMVDYCFSTGVVKSVAEKYA